MVEDALRLVSEGDRGDEYNFDPVPGGERVETPARVRVKLGPVSEAEVSLAIDARYRVPAALAPGRDARARRRVWLPVRLRLRLSRGLPRVAVQIDLDNTARDHRLRAHVRAPFAASRFEVESAFEIARRPIAPGPASFGSEHPSEFPIGATPQRGFATLADGSRALTVANRGCAEVEAVPEADGTHLAGAHAAARRRLAVARRSGAAPDPRRARRSRRPAPRGWARTASSSASGCTRTATRSAAPMPTASARRPGCSRPRAGPMRRCGTARGCSRSTIPRWWCPRSSRAPRARR